MPGQDPPDAANVVDGSELTGAADKGVKATVGGRVTVQRTCVHDNRNGVVLTARVIEKK